ncbi:hypothetical protein PHPALM_28845 [Phytophthora palmivora]|uniref:Uncharacterized protein n=1 Tax=Phytophthora palmivora TaxID=4796 RepID=A0A2P4X915_9STRA|nr:hypothetical protein PHPALM_28845 [Phytophthora palmivora]
MDKTLLNVLSPQLQALVEASLGSKLPPSAASKKKVDAPKNEVKAQLKASSSAAKFNPSELFTLKHPQSPGFVVKERFLGRQKALAVRDALTDFTRSETFHEAKVGAGENLRNDRTVRGDKIHWIQTPTDLNAPMEDGVSSAILHLRRQVESLVYGLKKASPELDLRNAVSTQFAVFEMVPGLSSIWTRTQTHIGMNAMMMDSSV